MARQEMWVHGNAVMLRFPGGKGDPAPSPHTPGHQMDGVRDPSTGERVEWTDVVGFHQDFGVTYWFRPNNSNKFMVAIPTPRSRDRVIARVDEVSFSFKTDVGVTMLGVDVFDNRDRIVHLPVSLTGDQHDLHPGVNVLPVPLTPVSAVGITFDVRSDVDGSITFFGVGAAFEV